MLLRIDTVGICGSDVHFLTKGRIAHFVVTEPMVIGHEASGVVHRVGTAVKHLKVGDRVAIEPGVPCRFCSFCKDGRYHLCPDAVFCSTPPTDGNLTRYYAHAADFCFKLPDHVTMEEGALMEPLAVAIHACKAANITLGTKVLVLGAGPIGLSTLIATQSMGASEVAIVDLIEGRLSVAKRDFGATHTILIEQNANEVDVVADIHRRMNGAPDVTFDCTGAQATVRLAMLATKSGGRAMIVGCGPPEVTVPLTGACLREVSIHGVLRYANDYPAALALVSSGKFNVKKLVTHHFDLTETMEAFDTSR